MDELLFLVHRIPYPPNKGDKIRSFNLLKQLAKRYRVHLGAFVDDPQDWQYVKDLENVCAETCFLGLDPGRAKLRSLVGLLSAQPLTLPYYRDRRMQAWVSKVLGGASIRQVVVFSAAMSQYLDDAHGMDLHRVIDLVDVDSEKWRAYAQQHTWPMSWLYRREAAALLRYERALAAAYDASVFVTREEAKLFVSLAPETAARVTFINNGVDTEYFDPSCDYASPYDSAERVLVFTGAMDYWANVDAVVWFANEVFPIIRAMQSDARFYIVGARPVDKVKRLARHGGVQITGAVHDIRPYIAHARAAVAPLRIARGIQNKVLEAMAMAKPVLATQAAMDGIDECPGAGEFVEDDPQAMAQLAVRLLREDVTALGDEMRHCMVQRYNWEAKIQQLIDLLQGEKRVVAA